MNNDNINNINTNKENINNQNNNNNNNNNNDTNNDDIEILAYLQPSTSKKLTPAEINEADIKMCTTKTYK